ncbi:hypothetical protein AB0K00_20590 [Dactylosporangium sp. NPDC049525]|uniref:hypothetical protein n=1 Tax=Dactylosporangium sp. NPDC049525 TaxID=3154730 RepID=UPI003413160C
MALLTATADHPVRGALVLVLFLLILAAGYAASCAWWPFAACRRCSGTAKLRSPFGRAFRLCPRCKGTGRRLRLGRAFYNAITHVHRDGTR